MVLCGLGGLYVVWCVLALLPEKTILPAQPCANMAGRRDKNAFTFVLKLLIISQMLIRVWFGWFRCDLEWFSGCLWVLWC